MKLLYIYTFYELVQAVVFNHFKVVMSSLHIPQEAQIQKYTSQTQSTDR